MKAASFLVLLALTAFAVGFPLVIWRIIHVSRGAPSGTLLKRLFLPLLFFTLSGLAVAASVFLFLSSRSDNGSASSRVMDSSQEYLSKKYGPSSEWHFSVMKHVYTSPDQRDGYYIVDYRSATRTGVLRVNYSDYDKNRTFTFEEQTEEN
jgi:hypothetical protein